MTSKELADLYVRFWKWYDVNVGVVDFKVIAHDVNGKSASEIEVTFRKRLYAILDLLKSRFYEEEKAKKLNSLSHFSWEELSLKLAIKGY